MHFNVKLLSKIECKVLYFVCFALNAASKEFILILVCNWELGTRAWQKLQTAVAFQQITP